jgi:hypothetical protein
VKKLIEELEKELTELIEKSGWSKQDIQLDYNAFRALKKRIDDSNSLHDDDDIQQVN